jgi:hypothetical protein
VTRRRPLPRLLRAQLWRPRHLAPLGLDELWLLAAVLRSEAPQVGLGEVARLAAEAGYPLSLRAVGCARTRLRRRGLCLRHGNGGDRVSLTLAGRLVAQVEAAHLLAPAVRRPAAAAPAVEVWCCAPRAPSRQTTTPAQESIR